MQKKLLTNGNAFKRTDGRWCGVVWYMDEHGERKRKSFSGTTKAEVNKKITEYIADFENQAAKSDESKKTLQESMQNWLWVFKFPSVEQTTYDRCECSAKNQIYPLLGEKAVGDITAADIKNLLNYWMNKNYAYGFCFGMADNNLSVLHFITVWESSVFHFRLHLLWAGIISVIDRPPINLKHRLVSVGTVISSTILSNNSTSNSVMEFSI